MRIIVQKYGGSSVADLERLRAAARRVVETAERGYAVVVVVSAMGHTTDELLARAIEVDPDPPRRELDMLLSAGERIAMSLLCIAIGRLGKPAVSLTGSQSGIITTAAHRVPATSSPHAVVSTIAVHPIVAGVAPHTVVVTIARHDVACISSVHFIVATITEQNVFAVVSPN